MGLRERVMTMYGVALLLLLISIPLSLLYNPIMLTVTIVVTLFVGIFQLISFLSAGSRTIVDLYEKDRYYHYYKYAGTIDPSGMALASGVIMMVMVAFTTLDIVDWAYLGLTFPNIFTVLWLGNGLLALIGGISARPLAKRTSKPKHQLDEDPTWT